MSLGRQIKLRAEAVGNFYKNGALVRGYEVLPMAHLHCQFRMQSLVFCDEF